ncbi:hypothetical protein CDCA_CDCA18G4561 [Cyanidium caldarium]|uniref:Uncharacterized protein n=1 Tax=Cyanidium caldarium TaxID=2771 RepID=A0AAV9J2D6_CYACA|nr:hypothetical protein CDCA_CDCA18G4561 [Cyanidium caldarium]
MRRRSSSLTRALSSPARVMSRINKRAVPYRVFITVHRLLTAGGQGASAADEYLNTLGSLVVRVLVGQSGTRPPLHTRASIDGVWDETLGTRAMIYENEQKQQVNRKEARVALVQAATGRVVAEAVMDVAQAVWYGWQMRAGGGSGGAGEYERLVELVRTDRGPVGEEAEEPLLARLLLSVRAERLDGGAVSAYGKPSLDSLSSASGSTLSTPARSPRALAPVPDSESESEESERSLYRDSIAAGRSQGVASPVRPPTGARVGTVRRSIAASKPSSPPGDQPTVGTPTLSADAVERLRRDLLQISRQRDRYAKQAAQNATAFQEEVRSLNAQLRALRVQLAAVREERDALLGCRDGDDDAADPDRAGGSNSSSAAGREWRQLRQQVAAARAGQRAAELQARAEVEQVLRETENRRERAPVVEEKEGDDVESPDAPIGAHSPTSPSLGSTRATPHELEQQLIHAKVAHAQAESRVDELQQELRFVQRRLQDERERSQGLARELTHGQRHRTAQGDGHPDEAALEVAPGPPRYSFDASALRAFTPRVGSGPVPRHLSRSFGGSSGALPRRTATVGDHAAKSLGSHNLLSEAASGRSAPLWSRLLGRRKRRDAERATASDDALTSARVEQSLAAMR